MWIGIGCLIALGVGIMMAVSSGKPTGRRGSSQKETAKQKAKKTMTSTSVRLFAAAAMLSLGMIGYPAISDAGATHAIEQQGQAKGHDKDKNKDKDKDKDKAAKAKTTVVVVDRDGHQRVVREYVTRGNLPPGLAKRKQLPPGLAKQLRETGELPPGLQPYFTPVPREIDGALPGVTDVLSPLLRG